MTPRLLTPGWATYWTCPALDPREAAFQQEVHTDTLGRVLLEESIVADLAYGVNKLRRDFNFEVKDKVALFLRVTPTVWEAVHWNWARLCSDVNASTLTVNPEESLTEWSTVEVAAHREKVSVQVALKISGFTPLEDSWR